MSFEALLQTALDVEQETDSVGFSGVQDSGLYPGIVTMAYVQEASSKALGLVLHIKGDNDKEIRGTLWMTSGLDKGRKNYYEKNGKKFYLPGFILANSLAVLTTGKEIGNLVTVSKVVNVYSTELRKETPTSVMVFDDIIGKRITVGVIKQVVDKTKKDGNNKYQPTGETREENEIEKFFRDGDNETTIEIAAKSEPTFHKTWADKHVGTVRNKASKSVGTPGMPSPSMSSSFAPTGSIFGLE